MATKSLEVLIIGTGIAGLSAAIHLSRFANVKILAKSSLNEGNTRYAQGGIASVWDTEDTFENHIQDTLEAGVGLCHPEIVKICVEEGPDRIRELLQWGVQFDKDLHQEGGHHQRRILHAQDQTGLRIEDALLQEATQSPNLQFFENHVAVDLIMEGKVKNQSANKSSLGKCLGAYVLSQATGKILPFAADVTLLATGGVGKIYLYTSNPDVATGDGIAMAYRAGAKVSNLEFMQFHPTCLYHPSAKNFLITEALRGEGAILRNFSGQDFMKHYHPMGSLAPRYAVSQAIDIEMKKTSDPHVWLDVSALSEKHLQEKFPQVYEGCKKFGIHIPHDLIPVVPAAHYMCGGVTVDAFGKTSVEGLFAVGEVACSGLHGANRLASNSLLEATVFSKRIADFIENNYTSHALKQVKILPDWDFGRAVDVEDRIDITASWKEIRTLMWNYVGIVRSNRRLHRARERLALLKHEINEDYWRFKIDRDLIELRNLLTVAELVVESALRRKESRGLHQNKDYPQTLASFEDDTVL